MFAWSYDFKLNNIGNNRYRRENRNHIFYVIYSYLNNSKDFTAGRIVFYNILGIRILLKETICDLVTSIQFQCRKELSRVRAEKLAFRLRWDPI